MITRVVFEFLIPSTRARIVLPPSFEIVDSDSLVWARVIAAPSVRPVVAFEKWVPAQPHGDVAPPGPIGGRWSFAGAGDAPPELLMHLAALLAGAPPPGGWTMETVVEKVVENDDALVIKLGVLETAAFAPTLPIIALRGQIAQTLATVAHALGIVTTSSAPGWTDAICAKIAALRTAGDMIDDISKVLRSASVPEGSGSDRWSIDRRVQWLVDEMRAGRAAVAVLKGAGLDPAPLLQVARSADYEPLAHHLVDAIANGEAHYEVEPQDAQRHAQVLAKEVRALRVAVAQDGAANRRLSDATSALGSIANTLGVSTQEQMPWIENVTEQIRQEIVRRHEARLELVAQYNTAKGHALRGQNALRTIAERLDLGEALVGATTGAVQPADKVRRDLARIAGLSDTASIENSIAVIEMAVQHLRDENQGRKFSRSLSSADALAKALVQDVKVLSSSADELEHILAEISTVTGLHVPRAELARAVGELMRRGRRDADIVSALDRLVQTQTEGLVLLRRLHGVSEPQVAAITPSQIRAHHNSLRDGTAADAIGRYLCRVALGERCVSDDSHPGDYRYPTDAEIGDAMRRIGEHIARDTEAPNPGAPSLSPDQPGTARPPFLMGSFEFMGHGRLVEIRLNDAVATTLLVKSVPSTGTDPLRVGPFTVRCTTCANWRPAPHASPADLIKEHLARAHDLTDDYGWAHRPASASDWTVPLE